MSDVLIKNIEIPKEKYIRVEIHHDGSMYVQKSGYYSFYVKSQDKAIELPPHGRLIDADRLEERSYLIKGVDGRIRTVIELCDIEDAPTIMEATE